MSQDISQQKDWLSAWKIFYEPEESLEKVGQYNQGKKLISVFIHPEPAEKVKQARMKNMLC